MTSCRNHIDCFCEECNRGLILKQICHALLLPFKMSLHVMSEIHAGVSSIGDHASLRHGMHCIPVLHCTCISTLLIFEPEAETCLLCRGNILELLEDVQELRPTLFYSVPRLYNRIYDRVMATIRAGDPLSRALFERAYAYKLSSLHAGDPSGGRVGRICDRLVFSKIKARLGGERLKQHVRRMVIVSPQRLNLDICSQYSI